MRRIWMTASFIIATLAGAGAGHAAELDVTVEGLEQKGRLMLAIVDTEAAWDGKEQPLLAIDARVTEDTMRFRLTLPEGRVAIRLFHDENSNGKLDTNLLGIPREGYGFSNNPRVLGPASFSDAAFVIKGSKTTTTVKVQ
ncbi:MAG: DUF2141 domain-containing protein [Myxococcota bacterium]